MLSFFKRTQKTPNLDSFCLEPYKVNFSLTRLVPGVDNVRYDVRLSQKFLNSSRKIIRHFLADHAQTHNFMEIKPEPGWQDLEKEFEEQYRLLLIGVVNQAKMEREIQIDFLAQTAIVKMILGEIRNQYECMIQAYIKAIRKVELSSSTDLASLIRLKEQLSDVRLKRPFILCRVGTEFFHYLAQIQEKHVKQIREINFGTESAVYADIFTNPIPHMQDSHDDFFMIDEYRILLGRRFDDPDQYLTLIELLKSIFSELFFQYTSLPHRKTPFGKTEVAADINDLIKQVKNIDCLINYFQSKREYKKLKKTKPPKTEIEKLKQKIKQQKLLFAFFYKKFDHKGLIKKIVASHQIYPIIKEYCPPLTPQQMVQYLIKPARRRRIVRQLKRSGKFYGKNFSLKPLKRQVSIWRKILWLRRKEIFIDFLKGFIRYHKDFENYKILKEAMDCVNIVHDAKIETLSRTNHTLFEFLLPEESVFQEKAIINHVIIKSDLRGSTQITRLMKEKGLNPASYFSLNFFDPITEILPHYGANKIFIEGDALILAITEHEQTPEGWYSVARACGLSVKIISIVRQYNFECHKKGLPVMEVGIGISHQNDPPAFLFDEGKKIMISPAINQADRLSSCSKALVKRLENVKKLFNLYVFQARRGKDQFFSREEETYTRYNVNGIELSSDAFKKLCGEIELRIIKAVLPEISNKIITFYCGKFQTLSGQFEKIVIRQAHMMEFEAYIETSRLKKTNKKFYEVVSNPYFYQYIDQV